MKDLYFKTEKDWETWLKINHDQVSELWLIFYKKETGIPSISYESSVETALCYGWIDSIIKKLDDKRFARKFTPRKFQSKWSESNKRRVKKLIGESRMTKSGMKKIEYAKKYGLWDKPDIPEINYDIPAEFVSKLKKHSQAESFFKSLAPTYQKQYIVWITMAKREETRKKRISESIILLTKKRKLGLK